MTTRFKVLLAASVLLFLASLTDVGSAVGWGALKPISAILFLIFFIGQLLHKEVVLFEEENRARMAFSKAPRGTQTATPSRQKSVAQGSRSEEHTSELQ